MGDKKEPLVIWTERLWITGDISFFHRFKATFEFKPADISDLRAIAKDYGNVIVRTHGFEAKAVLKLDTLKEVDDEGLLGRRMGPLIGVPRFEVEADLLEVVLTKENIRGR